MPLPNTQSVDPNLEENMNLDDQVEDPNRLVISEDVDEPGAPAEPENPPDKPEGPAEPEEKPDPAETISTLQSEIEAAKNEIGSLKNILQQQQQSVQAPPPKTPDQYTNEDWQRIEEKFGVTRQAVTDENGVVKESVNMNPRKLLTAINDVSVNAARFAIQQAQTLVHEQIADLRFDAVLSGLETEHPDIKQYGKAIREFVDKTYVDPQARYSRETLLNGLYYAKGKGVKAMINKAVNSNERNKRIVRVAPSASKTSQPKGGALSPQEREELKSFGYSDEEIQRTWGGR